MTLLDEPLATSVPEDAQLLFREARERRRHRWLIAGITGGIVVVAIAAMLGITSGRTGGGTARPTAPSAVTPAISNATESLNFRPVLCVAPALTLSGGGSAATGPLPTCAPASQLTASNLNVSTATGQALTQPPPDAQFSNYASTTPQRAAPGDTVLLPGGSGQGGTRYVLGPAALTQSGVASATAVDQNGQWVVDLTLTAQGAVRWDALAQQQFHAVVGVVENGTVLSAPLMMPVQSSFTSFGGRVQIAGVFTRQQAEALAHRI
jgi:hypothetical protein